MIESFNRFFRNRVAPDVAVDDDAHRLRVATCALLLEAANADQDFTADEREKVEATVAGRFNLDAVETAELLEVAEAERADSGDIYNFARLINEGFERPRKLAILELLWEVVYSDGILEAHEDALMHKVGNLLGVRHEELMALKLRVRRRAE